MRGTGDSTDGRTYQNDFLHNLVAGDCVSCHIVKSATQTDWTGGSFSHSPVPGSCTTCHAITIPAPGASAFDHSQPGLSDCKSCHAFAGQRWTGASALPSVVTLTPPSGKSSWGNITAPHPTLDPAKTGMTCATCHATNPNAQIIDYDHLFPVDGGNGSNCVYCHYEQQTVTSADVETKDHKGATKTKDCDASGCHRPKEYPRWNGTTFTGGEWGGD